MTEIVFRKQGDKWYIVGPAEKLVSWTNVEVTKADGTTKIVTVGKVHGQKNGQAVAGFSKTQTEMKAAKAPQAGYTNVQNGAYGPGRRYHSQPGATQYDDGSGTYRVQIGDES